MVLKKGNPGSVLLSLFGIAVALSSAVPDPYYSETNNFVFEAADSSCPVSGSLEVCQSAHLEGVNDVSSYFSVCPDDGDPNDQNVCYYSSVPCCSSSVVPELSNCNSSSTLQVAGREFSVTFLNLYIPGIDVPNQVCFKVEPDIDHCIEDCEIGCITTDQVCFENTMTGDVSSCTAGVCRCQNGYLPPDCCNCNTTSHYRNGTKCEPYCRNNCQTFGPENVGGCATCRDGFVTAPKCCQCRPGTEEINGNCVCDKEQDLYFLIDATISYDYVTFCKTMVVAQILTAAFNPSSSSGTKLYGALFQRSISGSEPIEEVFNRDETCNDIVTNDLVTLVKDFYLCKGPGGTHSRFDSVCASETIAINGLKKIETVASKSPSKQKAVLILTDGAIEDPNNELETVMGSLNSAGIETMIAGRIGTNEVYPNLRLYASDDQNAVADQTPFGLGLKIVQRLSAEGILCEDHAKRINDSLEQASNDNTFNYYCTCLPDLSTGDTCTIQGREFPATLTYPTCGGSLDVGITFSRQKAVQQEVNVNHLEEEIFAAVEKVLEDFKG